MWENTDQNNSEYGDFLYNVTEIADQKHPGKLYMSDVSDELMISNVKLSQMASKFFEIYLALVVSCRF